MYGMNLFFNEFAPLVIALSILILITIYVLGHLTQNKQLKSMFSVEFSQFWSSLALYLSMGGIVLFINATIQFIVTSLGFPPTTDVYTWLQYQLSTLQENVGREIVFLTIVGQSAAIGGNTKYTTGYPGAKTVSGQFYPGIDLFSSSIFVVRGLLVIVIGSLTVQILVLDLLKVLAFGFFLPLGIILRFLPALRNYGNELIAATIALGMVMPLTYFILYAALYDIAHIRGGYYEKFLVQNADFMKPLLDPAKTLEDGTPNATIFQTELEDKLTSTVSTTDTYTQTFTDYLSNLALTLGYGAYYIISMPFSAILLFYHYIKVGGYIVYAVAVPSFAITLAMASTNGIRDFIQSL